MVVLQEWFITANGYSAFCFDQKGFVVQLMEEQSTDLRGDI
jgi:hypothetical protein